MKGSSRLWFSLIFVCNAHELRSGVRVDWLLLDIVCYDLIDEWQILSLWGLELFAGWLGLLCLFELLKSLFELSDIESLIGVEVANFECFGERLLFLEDAIDSLATVRLARPLVLFFHYNIIHLKPYAQSHSPG